MEEERRPGLGLDLFLDVLLDVFYHVGDGTVLGRVVHEDAGELDDADDAEEEVDGGEATREE